MRQKMDNWQRIDSVIRWANMTINYFALYIGLPRGENLYQIKKGNNGISRNLAYKYEGENETYIEASAENSGSILYDKEIRDKPRTRRTKRNV